MYIVRLNSSHQLLIVLRFKLNNMGVLLVQCGGRVLPLTVGIARRWGRLSAELGHHNADLRIAATALENNLTVITLNTRHFMPTLVAVINPFEIK